MSDPEPHSPSTLAKDSIWPSWKAGKVVTSQFSTESAVLERGEERVELGERGAVGGFQFVDGGDASGEVLLELDGRKDQLDLFKARLADHPLHPSR